jgi:hypothetical protein
LVSLIARVSGCEQLPHLTNRDTSFSPRLISPLVRVVEPLSTNLLQLSKMAIFVVKVDDSFHPSELTGSLHCTLLKNPSGLELLHFPEGSLKSRCIAILNSC